jgi:uncharacterized protein YacL
MYPILKHAHSGLRWILLLLLIAAVVNAAMNFSAKNGFREQDRKLGLFALIFTHVQLILGLILYFISPKVQFVSGMMKDSMVRFYTVEHLTMMIIAVALITIGYSRAKKKTEATAKFKTTFWFYLIGLVVILASIPWPFRNLGGGWF